MKTIDQSCNDFRKLMESKSYYIDKTLMLKEYLADSFDTVALFNLMPLKIPNRSVVLAFRMEVWNFFKDRIENASVKDLIGALLAGEANRAEAAMNQILDAILTFYHEYHEYSYHLILDGFFTGMGYQVLSEVEAGYGRSDLIIKDPARKRCLILELKHEKEEKGMKSALKEASSQIIKKKFESVLKYEGYVQRLQYAMAFCDKKSLISSVVNH